MSNLEEAKSRCEYASKLLTENNIPHAVKNSDIGHINIFYWGKCVMSFWARTGKIIFTCSIEDIKYPLDEEDRGINTLIKVYKKNFEED